MIIPGRCEEYFQQTIDSVIENARGDVEVIPVIDGNIPDSRIEVKDDRVKPIFLEESIGQRAAYNLGVEKSTGDYIMKIDAHALVSPGFDVELASTCPEKGTVIPTMGRLDKNKWMMKPRGKTHFMYFGKDCYTHFWREYRKRPEAKGDLVETMANQGSCWFWPRKWHDYVGGLDEACGSWGMVGIETTLKTWLCGGQQLVNKKAWQAHWFRRSDGGFTYPMNGRQVAKAHNYCRSNWFHNDSAFRHQNRPFRWVLDKFAPVPSWEFDYLPGTPPGDIVDKFHYIFYSHWSAVGKVNWQGYKTTKYPNDLILYQQIIHKFRPEVIIECGTDRGGSALFYAHIFDLEGQGEVITIDKSNDRRIKEGKLPKHPRVTYINGNTVDPNVRDRVKDLVSSKRCMVTLDSNHRRGHVKTEMRKYGKLVTKGQFMVVEDTCLHGHPVRPNDPPGPYEAVEWYLSHWHDFERDSVGEKYLITQNPGGWLKKVK